MKNSIPTGLTCAALGLAPLLHADDFTYQNGVSPTAGYTGNEARMTTTFGGGTTTTEQIGGSLAGGSGRLISPVRFNSLSSAAGWNNPTWVGYDVSEITLTLKVSSNNLVGSGTLALVFNNRPANSDWVEGQVNQLVKSTGNSWAGPSGTLSSATSGAPFASGGAWDFGPGAGFNGMPIIATATVDNTNTPGTTVTFNFSEGLSSAERIEIIQIWSHDYGSGSLTVGGQTYTANPGLFLSFSDAGTITSGDIRFHDDDAANAADRPILVVSSTAGTPPAPPAAPSGLTVGSPTNSTLSLNWTDNSSDETGFKIERSPDGSTGWTLIHTTAANVTSYTNTGLSASTTYYYRVAATNGVGDSSYTTTASGTTLAASALTFTYQNGVSPTAGYTGNQGRTTSSFGAGATVYDFMYGASLGGQGRFIAPIRFNGLSSAAGWVDPNSPGYSVNSLSVTLKVSANSLDGSGTLALVFNNRGANSAWTEAGVTQVKIDGTNGWSGPGGVMTNVGSGVAPLGAGGQAWDTAANNGMPIMATATVDASNVVNSTVTFTFSGLSAAEKLELVRIWSHNYGGGSLVEGGQTYTANPGMFLGFSATSTYATGSIQFYPDDTATVANRPALNISATASVASPPAAPSALAVSTVASSTQLSLTWTDNASDETGFKVERSPDGSTGWTQIAALAANAVGYTHSSLTPGSTHYYRVIATNGSGDSAPSNTASATTWTYSQAWFNSFSLPVGTSLGADGDNDGLNNALEFVLGGNPTTNDTPSVRPTVSASGTDLVVTFKRSDESEGQPINVKVQTSTDLSSWSDFATIGATTGSGYTVAENGSASDTIVVTIPKGVDTKKFARVVATY